MALVLVQADRVAVDVVGREAVDVGRLLGVGGHGGGAGREVLEGAES